MFAVRAYAAAIPLWENIKTSILNPIITFLFAAAVLYFFYGVYEMVRNADNEDARKQGQQHVLYGTIGLFIMVAVYGILNLVCRTIGCN